VPVACTVVALAPDRHDRVRVVIDPAPPEPEEDPPGLREAWAAAQRRNPRLVDGPILHVRDLDAQARTLRCRASTYKRLAVADRLPTGVVQLGIKGLVIGHDATGRQHVLLGRRGVQTRVYAGQWETAPAGGVDPPRAAAELGRDDLLAALGRESEEELGLALAPTDCRFVAVVTDPAAHSHDLVVRVEPPEPVDLARRLRGARRWEYSATTWVMLTDLGHFLRDQAGAISPPTRALFAWLGWARPPAG